MKSTFLAASALAAAFVPITAYADAERFSVIFGGRNVGHLNADVNGDQIAIDFDYKNNGRGPTIRETIRTDATGLPVAWKIDGTTTFGSKTAENYAVTGKRATWTDSTGPGKAARGAGLYVAQGASPWALGLYARALLKDADNTMPALPGGMLRLTKGEAVTIAGKGGTLQTNAYDISGIDLTPTTMLLDAEGDLVSIVSADFIIIRAGYEGEEERLRGLAAKWSTDRYVTIQKKVAHDYKAPVRIRNVRLFDSKTATLTKLMSVLVNGRTIAAIEPLDSRATPGEVTIDGAGGTLIPGMYEMHAHLGQDDALLNLMAGITTVRDMGNDNAVLAELSDRIDAGIIGGPRIIKSGFLEGRSPFSANNGFVVDNQAKAIDAVRWYGARGYNQIKVYNSMNPAWVPAVVKEAHSLGMRVAGHVPAFSTADAMIAAGYDEMTHINQFMLGWVIKPTEDTRTLFRLTALKRLPSLDLNSAPVQRTIQAMVDGKKAIDPTIGIHEQLTQNRDGRVPPGAVDYLDHMPIGYQRDAKKAWVDTGGPGDDVAYRGAFDKIIATTKMLHDRGVFIVPGTDTGGSFTYHRELELLTRVGFTPAQVVKRATYDMAEYLGEDQATGSITRGKRADFFLVPGDPTKDVKAIKTIRMVVKDGTVYFPSEVYPEFGIKPFADAPKVTVGKK